MSKLKDLVFFIAIIRWYQLYISPYKGFSCAHRALRGGVSCSEYALSQFQTKKPLEAYRKTRLRMHECGLIYRDYVRAQPETQQISLRNRRHRLYLRLIDPRLYFKICRGFLIHHWPKHNRGGLP